jgi:hypothetical protein
MVDALEALFGDYEEREEPNIAISFLNCLLEV